MCVSAHTLVPVLCSHKGCAWPCRYAEELLATLPAHLEVVYFTCTGSEANELAVRLARTYTKKHDVLVVDGAYHGTASLFCGPCV